MDGTISGLKEIAEMDYLPNAFVDIPATCADAAKFLSECRMAMSSLIDGDPALHPAELIEKHRAWFMELLA